MTSSDVVIVGAARTPIGKFLGAFRSVSAVELGIAATEGLLERAGIDRSQVDQVIFGMARQAGSGPNVARQVQIGSGMPESGTALTVNQACASGLRAIVLAANEIVSGSAQAIVAGGTESMTRIPFYLPDMRLGMRLGNKEILDGNYQDGFHCPLVDAPMGMTAETLAEKYEIAREEQDAYAVVSQQKCGAALEAGKFTDEIVPVTVKSRRGDVVVDTDEHPRPDATVEGLMKLSSVFKEEGTVHAGNSSGITDGAAALLVTSEEFAQTHDLTVMARLTGSAMAGVDPAVMGLGPVPATQKLLEKAGRELSEIDLIELNEAFAAQVLACDREMGLDHDRLNVNGGAIALGHPIGCTGARIVVTLLHEMVRRDSKTGLATLCVSGGMGISALFERA
ncbi:MAG: thiolase family protein [Planctomycetota bacterium]|nr:thiolase family protein [Planctomycetota bacterium]